MRKTLLIAKREYLAFVRTIGFWISLFTLPLLIAAVIAVPILMRQTAPVKTLSVAVLDLTGENLAPKMTAMVQAHVTPPNPDTGFMAKMANKDVVRLAALPKGLTPDMTVSAAEAKIPALLEAPQTKDHGTEANTILLAYDQGGVLHFHIWSTKGFDGKLEELILWDLHGLQYYKLAQMSGIDPNLAHDMRESRADIKSLTPVTAVAAPKNGLSQKFRDNAPQIMGAFVGYISWMAIFSSSMILLSGVIEEKSSKVLEVLLASTSTESLLLGKVLGVAAVMATVAGIWALAGFALTQYGLVLLPAQVLQAISAATSGLFSPGYLALLSVYFVGGYLMYGVTFASIGAFCETQKDAQAIMGPMMVVLMIPMLSMQAAFVSPDTPVLRYLSYVPIFTPFLMPLRLAQALPLWEIALTLFDMALMGSLMIILGRRAFKQGALAGGKLTWGTLFRLAVSKPTGV